MIKRLFAITLVVVLTLLIGCTAAPAKPAGKTSLKFAVIPLLINLPGNVALKEGLCEKHNLSVEIISFRSTAEQETALLTGAVDGIFQHIFATVMLNKEKETCKIVGACTMPGMYQLVAASGSGLTDVKGLKGKEVASATNTSVDYAMEQLLKEGGLSINDITKVNVPVMPMRLEMLNQGKFPAAMLSRPLSDVAALSGAKILAGDTAKPLGGPGIVVSQNALKSKSDAIGRFIQAWQEASAMINANPEKYRSLLVESANIPAQVSQTMEVMNYPKLKNPDKSEVDSVVDWLMQKGIISKRISYQEVVETKYLK